MSIIKTLAGFSLLIWISGFSLLIWISMVSAKESPPSAYEMLEKFNFPKGILPEGVNRYVLHEDNRFEVYLNGDCKFQVEEGGYYLHYQKKISGRVEFGSLKDLQGVSVKILFMWIGITEVSSGGGDLSFYVGPMSASFPITNFEECPQCGGVGGGGYAGGGLNNNQNNNKMVSDS